MKLKTVSILFWAAILSGAVISGLGSTNGINWLTFLGMAMMCGGLILKVLLYRCPHCGVYLDRSSGEFCPHCGRRVNGE